MAQIKDLIVNGVGRFIGKLYASEFIGKLTGNADTATSATKAAQDESGNNIKSSYASSISISDHTITLKNKNGASLGTVTVPDNNTVYTHPTTSGNKHIPSGGSSGQILRWSADGTAVWGADNNTKYGVATSSALGLVKSGTDITVDSSGNVSVNDDSHNHVISNVDGLQSALDGKAASSHTHSQYLTSHQDISQVMKNRGGITNTTDFNKIVESGCYKVQMASWGAADTYHSPNEFNSKLYSFGLMLVIRPATNLEAENRITQIYFPHHVDDNLHPVLMRMHNGSDINSGWQAWHRFSNNTDTWRGIQNNLTSDSTTDSLSAAQGKVLKGLVDGKAASSHTHNYAGSSSAGGAATKVYGTLTNPSSSKTYYIPFHTNASSESKSLLNNNGLQYYTLEGTTSAVGTAQLGLGNNVASGTAGNKQGKIYMYGTSSGYTTIVPGYNSTSNITITLPSSSGTLSLNGHTHSYLPLSGGTVAGNLTVNGTFKANNIITGTKPLTISSASALASISLTSRDLGFTPSVNTSIVATVRKECAPTTLYLNTYTTFYNGTLYVCITNGSSTSTTVPTGTYHIDYIITNNT